MTVVRSARAKDKKATSLLPSLFFCVKYPEHHLKSKGGRGLGAKGHEVGAGGELGWKTFVAIKSISSLSYQIILTKLVQRFQGNVCLGIFYPGIFFRDSVRIHSCILTTNKKIYFYETENLENITLLFQKFLSTLLVYFSST